MLEELKAAVWAANLELKARGWSFTPGETSAA